MIAEMKAMNSIPREIHEIVLNGVWYVLQLYTT